MARGMGTTSWGGQDVAVLVDVSENKSRLPGGCAVHLRMLAMAAASKGGVTMMAGQGRASWRIQEDEMQRYQHNNQPAKKRHMERHKGTRVSGAWKAGGALRGQEAAAAQQEAMQQPASK